MRSNASTSRSAAAAVAGACAAAAMLAATGVLQLAHEQSSPTTTEGAVEHLLLALMTATCLALVPAVLQLGRLAGAVLPARLASGGLVALGLLCVVSNVRGEDPAFVAAIAAPANLLWFGGLVALGVLLRRRGVASLAVAVAVPLTWPLTLIGSQAGGGSSRPRCGC